MHVVAGERGVALASLAAAAVAGAVLFAPAPALAEFPDESQEEAKVRFQKGVELFKDEDFVGALVEFKAAYNAKPHFLVRYNIGMTLYNLHRYAEAFAEPAASLAEGGVFALTTIILAIFTDFGRKDAKKKAGKVSLLVGPTADGFALGAALAF